MFKKCFKTICSKGTKYSTTNSKKVKANCVGYTPVHFKIHDTWNRDICVLGRCNESVTPDRARHEALTSAGLGENEISISKQNGITSGIARISGEQVPQTKGWRRI